MHDLFFVHVLLVTIRVDHLTLGRIIFEQGRNGSYKNPVCAEVAGNFCADGIFKHLFLRRGWDILGILHLCGPFGAGASLVVLVGEFVFCAGEPRDFLLGVSSSLDPSGVLVGLARARLAGPFGFVGPFCFAGGVASAPQDFLHVFLFRA